MAKPISEEHSLLCGMVWGMAMRHGLPMNPVVDDSEGYEGYTDTLELELPDGYGGQGSPVRVFLVVQPPATEVEPWRREEEQLGLPFGDLARALELLPAECRALRAANKLTQGRLAREAGISTKTIERFENDEPITARNLVALLRALERLSEEEASRG